MASFLLAESCTTFNLWGDHQLRIRTTRQVVISPLLHKVNNITRQPEQFVDCTRFTSSKNTPVAVYYVLMRKHQEIRSYLSIILKQHASAVLFTCVYLRVCIYAYIDDIVLTSRRLGVFSLTLVWRVFPHVSLGSLYLLSSRHSCFLMTDCKAN